ncbi:MAG: exosome complex RNA-binding protein Csl4 [Candidatus Heimdallarchaeaceae archaeon]|jgi:exosome complex RNA-binding protein Csl4
MTDEIFDRLKGPNELVFPGTRIAVTEEFLGGTGTYSNEDYIFSAVIGYVNINIEKHEISVLSKPKMTPVPKVGDIFIGGVSNLSRQMITVSINYINNQEIYPTYTLIIHISQVSRDYLESADEALSLGDFVRGKIIDAKTIPLQGSLIGSQLGVIQSNCNSCGGKLNKIGRTKLKCSECSKIESRNTTVDYGSGHLAFKL